MVRPGSSRSDRSQEWEDNVTPKVRTKIVNNVPSAESDVWNQSSRSNVNQPTLNSSTQSDDPPPTPSEIYLPGNYDLPVDPVYVQEVITDPIILGRINDECEDLFKSHKITPQNAFSLRLIECIDEVIKLESSDKNNMQKVGKTLEVGTKIFVCRVEHTHNAVLSMAENLAEKKKKRGEIDDGDRPKDDDGPGDTSYLSDDEENQSCYKLSEKEKAFDYLDDGTIVPTFWGDSDMQNKNIGANHQFDMDDLNVENNGELRRLKLKESFDSYALGSKRFDYASLIFGKSHLKEKNSSHVGTKMNLIPFNPIIVNTSAMGHLLKLGFLRFGKNKFDMENYDIWGNPQNVIGVNNDDNMRERLLEKRRQLRERLSIRREDLLSQHSHRKSLSQSQVCSQEIDNDLAAPYMSMGPQSVHNMSEDQGYLVDVEVPEHMHDDYNPVDADGELKQLNIHEITSLDDVDHYYDALKNFKLIEPNLYGWCGPNFIRNRRPRNKPNGSRTKSRIRKKKDLPKPVDIFALDWQDSANRYVQVEDYKIEFSEEQIDKFYENKPIIPFMGDCDDLYHQMEENDLFNDAFEGVFTTGNAVFERLTKYNVDCNRHIFQGILKCKNAKSDPDTESPQDEYEIGGAEYDDGPDFHAAEPNEAVEGVRELDEAVIALGANDNFIGETDLELLRHHKLIPSAIGQEYDFGSEAEEYPLSRFTENDSLKYARRPKPINIGKVKECITKILKEKLFIDKHGSPMCEEPTQLDMLTLLSEMLRNLDDLTIRYLSIAITLVATLHVVVELRLFMDSGKLGSKENPLIICHGKNWKHEENIPGVNIEQPGHIYESSGDSDFPKPKRVRKNRVQVQEDGDQTHEMVISQDSSDEDVFVDANAQIEPSD